MKVQILFNDKNPRHKALIDYLEMQGKQSGVPKELLLFGFKSLLAQQATDDENIVNIKPKCRANINSIAGG